MRTTLKTEILIFLAMFALFFHATLQAGSYDSDVAVFDKILAETPASQPLVQIGDMYFARSVIQSWRNSLAQSSKPGVTPESSFATSGTSVTLWTSGTIPYTFNANVSAAHQTAAVDAMAEWATYANIHFVARTAQANYIVISDGGGEFSGGSSAVGMLSGSQALNIGSSSWNRGTILHELGHALGLIHEHQRSDRDTYVTINFSNVPGGASDGNFVLVPASTNTGAYDFLSVMHYPRKQFAVNPALDTITPKPAYTQFGDIMGTSPDRILSRRDRDGMAVLYGAGPVLSTVVTNTKDSGPGSLRAAIYKAFDIATDTPGATPTITFQIPLSDPNFSGGVFTIRPSDRLPAPGPGTTIDATTQTAFTGDTNASGPEVVLNGSQQPPLNPYGMALRLSATNVTVKGLVINGCANQGILITGTGAIGNTVAGCYIGTNAVGTAAATNTFAGIEISGGAMGNYIGGTTVAASNVISGNTAQGILIRDSTTHGNFVTGNYLGLKASGTAALPNGFAGIEISGGAQGNIVGGTTAATRNVISGNTIQGVFLNSAATTGNIVSGNYIGTNSTGSAAVANGAAGVEIAGGAMANTIGGTAVGSGNVLSGNLVQGILISGTGTNSNTVAGNWIGLNGSGTDKVSNGKSGIEVSVGAQSNVVGGTTAGARNVISGNTIQGVFIHAAGTTGNVVLGNFIGTNPAGTAAIANGAAGVEITGTATANTVGGIAAGAGNVLSGNGTQGVKIGDVGTTGNVVAGNFIGLNSTGTSAVPNVSSGVGIFNGATGNIIGGTSAGAGNIISGNTIQGIYITDAGTGSNTVAGNWIGLNGAGTNKISNGTSGIEIGGSAQGNVIGGTTAVARNVISGNTDRGVFLYNTTGNVISGNYIGTNSAGNAAIANLWAGVEIQSGGTANMIGGTAPSAGNVISGNGGRNVLIDFAGADNNTIAGNLIGLNAAGSAALVNGGPGVQIWGGAQGNTIGGTSGGRNYISGNTGAGLTISDVGTNANVVVGNSIGTTPFNTVVTNTAEGISLFNGPQGNIIGDYTTLGAANLISGNGTSGVAIYNASTGNRISGNSITGNGGRGIDLWGDGVTANDLGDADTGPNNLQNFPVLTSAVLGVGTTINGTLNSTGSTSFRVEFFTNSVGDASGYGEGQNFIGAISVTTNGSGNATFAPTLQAIVPAGQKITATATDPAGNTSEFAQNVTITATDTDLDGIPDAWMIAMFGHTTGLASDKSRASDDADGDGMTNLQEFLAGTNPKNSTSVFRISAINKIGSDMRVSFSSISGKAYRVEMENDLTTNLWVPLVDQILGTGTIIQITDPGAATLTRRFYRVVGEP